MALSQMEILEKLFGSKAKVKVMRLFLYNQDEAFDPKDIRERAKITPADVRREVKGLEKIGLLKKKTFIKNVLKKKGKKTETVKKKSKGWMLNTGFIYLSSLQEFLMHLNPMRHRDILDKLGSVGKIKLLVISGVFIQENESRVDLLIVGDRIKKPSLQSVIQKIEAEIGKELTYSVFETDDFEYRLAVCDKLVRDILDYEHEKVINKLEVS